MNNELNYKLVKTDDEIHSFYLLATKYGMNTFHVY